MCYVDIVSNSNSRVLDCCFRIYFLLWCALSACHVILEKRMLNDFPCPLTLTMLKLGIATLWSVSLWILRLRTAPKHGTAEYRHIVRVAFFNTLGLSLANICLFSGTVFLSQTTRAAQASTTLLVAICTKSAPPTFFLLVVFGGISYASTVPPSDTCFITGMASNLAFSLRGVYSNRIKWHDATPANNFSVITMLSFLFMIPIALVMEGEIVCVVVCASGECLTERPSLVTL